MTTATLAPQRTHDTYTELIHTVADARATSDTDERNRAIAAARGQLMILREHLAAYPENDWGQLALASDELDDVDPGGHLVIVEEDEVARCTTCTWTGAPSAADNHEATGDDSPPPINPDCQADKHHACTGDAWDFNADMPTNCACGCH